MQKIPQQCGNEVNFFVIKIMPFGEVISREAIFIDVLQSICLQNLHQLLGRY